MDTLREALIGRLVDKGLEPDLIPGFIRLAADAVTGSLSRSQEEINGRLHFLGWDDFDLDYHTLQLIIANLEAEGVSVSEMDRHHAPRLHDAWESRTVANA